ncbi:MAG: hypothetical protein ACLPT4_16965 [Verrucomicrobiia bacterium]
MMAANVPNGAITSVQLASNAVTSANLAAGAVTTVAIANGAVGANQLAIDSINSLIQSNLASTVGGATNNTGLLYIERPNGGTNNRIDFPPTPAGISNWAANWTSGDTAIAIGGQYNLTNVIFSFIGLSNVVAEALGTQIIDVFTTYMVGSADGAYEGAFYFDGAVGVQMLGDWNFREIFAPNNACYQDTMLFSFRQATDCVVDGFHGQYEFFSTANIGWPYPIIAATANLNNSIRNSKIGLWNGTGNQWSAPSLGSFHGNNSIANALVLVNDVFYGDPFGGATPVWTGMTNPPPPTFYNCFAIDDHTAGVSQYASGGTAMSLYCGTIDTNENATYWLPGTPVDVCPPLSGTMKRIPPDCGTLTGGLTVYDSTGTNLLLSVTGTSARFGTNSTITASGITASGANIGTGEIANLAYASMTTTRTNVNATIAAGTVSAIFLNNTNVWVFDTSSGVSSNTISTIAGAAIVGEIQNFPGNGNAGNLLIIDSGTTTRTLSGSRYDYIYPFQTHYYLSQTNHNYLVTGPISTNPAVMLGYSGTNVTLTIPVAGSNLTLNLSTH